MPPWAAMVHQHQRACPSTRTGSPGACATATVPPQARRLSRAAPRAAVAAVVAASSHCWAAPRAAVVATLAASSHTRAVPRAAVAAVASLRHWAAPRAAVAAAVAASSRRWAAPWAAVVAAVARRRTVPWTLSIASRCPKRRNYWRAWTTSFDSRKGVRTTLLPPPQPPCCLVPHLSLARQTQPSSCDADSPLVCRWACSRSWVGLQRYQHSRPPPACRRRLCWPRF